MTDANPAPCHRPDTEPPRLPRSSFRHQVASAHSLVAPRDYLSCRSSPAISVLASRPYPKILCVSFPTKNPLRIPCQPIFSLKSRNQGIVNKKLTVRDH